MQWKDLAPVGLVGLVVGIVLFSALVFGPSGFFRVQNPDTNSDVPGREIPRPGPLAFDTPSWAVGDTWTYQAGPMGMDGDVGGARVLGVVTRTVVSANDAVVNVTTEGSFQAQWSLAPTPEGSDAAGFIMLDYRMHFHEAAVGGYTWYRASDLATLKEVRTIQFDGMFETDAGTYGAAYTAIVETTFDPALDVWSFPLEADESWIATSTATIHAVVEWVIETPEEPWAFGKEVTFTRDIDLRLSSGAAEDVVTPAGTFSAIPVRTEVPHVRVFASPGPDIAAGLEEDIPIPRVHTSESWFSETAKNVVMAVFTTGGFRLDLALTSYDVS